MCFNLLKLTEIKRLYESNLSLVDIDFLLIEELIFKEVNSLFNNLNKIPHSIF